MMIDWNRRRRLKKWIREGYIDPGKAWYGWGEFTERGLREVGY